MEYGVSSSWILCSDTISNLCESDELVDIDCATFISVHLHKDSVYLVLCHRCVACFHNQVSKALFVDELVLVEQLNLVIIWIPGYTFLNLLFKESSKVLHLIIEVKNLSLLPWHKVCQELWLRNTAVTISVECSHNLVSTVESHLATRISWPYHLSKLVGRESTVAVDIKPVKQFLYFSLKLCLKLKAEAVHASLDRESHPLDYHAELVN